MSSNRRQYERHMVAVAAEVEMAGDMLIGETRDVSVGGVSAILNQELPEGQQVPLTLILTQDGIEDPTEDPFETQARVMWVSPSDGGLSMAGLRFDALDEASTKQLQRFLAALGENA